MSDQKSLDKELHKNLPVRKAYQFLQIRVQLLGRGITNEIMNLYVNGKKLKYKVKTMHEFLNFLGVQGFRIVTAELETEGVDNNFSKVHFYTMQREIFTQDDLTEDIFATLDRTKQGADFGESVRNFLEFTTTLDNLPI